MKTLSLYHEALKLMGNRFQLTAVADDEAFAREAIQAGISEIQRIERLLTTYSEDSETARINQSAGIAPVQVSGEIIRIVERSIRISEITQGAFDITYGSVDKSLWNFDTRLQELPDKVTARQMARLINFRNIMVNRDDSTIMLKEKGMRIGFGGIGKGYAAEMAKKIMREKGIESGIVNAAGDMTTWGAQPDGKPWTIGIADPNSKESIFSYMNITDMSVATSGNYSVWAPTILQKTTTIIP